MCKCDHVSKNYDNVASKPTDLLHICASFCYFMIFQSCIGKLILPWYLSYLSNV